MHNFMGHALKLLLLYSSTIASCSTTDKKQETKTETHSDLVDITQKPITPKIASIDIDTLTIDKRTAVFYQPDSLQIEKRKKEVGVQDFMAGADDYIYSINTSSEYLEKQGLKVLDAKSKRFLKFVSADKKVQLVKLDTLPELWGICLFDPNKKPYYADMTMIEDEYKKYYK